MPAPPLRPFEIRPVCARVRIRACVRRAARGRAGLGGAGLWDAAGGLVPGGGALRPAAQPGGPRRQPLTVQPVPCRIISAIYEYPLYMKYIYIYIYIYILDNRACPCATVALPRPVPCRLARSVTLKRHRVRTPLLPRPRARERGLEGLEGERDGGSEGMRGQGVRLREREWSVGVRVCVSECACACCACICVRVWVQDGGTAGGAPD
jgi:hypothetical protein